jgi:uncharacterized protein YraI
MDWSASLNMNKKSVCFLLVVLILAGCSFPGTAQPAPTTDINLIITAAAATAFAKITEAAGLLSPTPSATLTEPPVPTATEMVYPTSIPTIVPMSGVVRSNANVRAVPAKSKTQDLGGIFLGNNVKVIGRNDAATWLYILYADSPTGTGWVTTKAITLDGDMGLLPIVIYPFGEEGEGIMLPPLLYTITGTPLPPSTPPAGWDKWGTVNQLAKVRVGPSTGFVSIGTLDVGQIVTFRGRITENEWVQIDYPSGPDGHGWISKELIVAHDGFGGLPYYNLLGTPVTEAPVAPEVTTDPNATPAPTDTPTPEPPSPAGVEAEVTAQINVRSGPAQTYDSYGMLNPKDKVVITGLTLNGYWYQIQYASSPTGYGWAASQYLKVLGDVNKLPYFTNEGTPVPK